MKKSWILKYFKPKPVSPLTRISLNVQTKAQLKTSRTRSHSNPQKAIKLGPKSSHLNTTLENKPWEKQTKKEERKKKATFQNPFLLFLSFVLCFYYPPPFTEINFKLLLTFRCSFSTLFRAVTLQEKKFI